MIIIYSLLPSNPGVRGCVASCLVRASRHWQLRMCIIKSLLVILNI